MAFRRRKFASLVFNENWICIPAPFSIPLFSGGVPDGHFLLLFGKNSTDLATQVFSFPPHSVFSSFPPPLFAHQTFLFTDYFFLFSPLFLCLSSPRHGAFRNNSPPSLLRFHIGRLRFYSFLLFLRRNFAPTHTTSSQSLLPYASLAVQVFPDVCASKESTFTPCSCTASVFDFVFFGKNTPFSHQIDASYSVSTCILFLIVALVVRLTTRRYLPSVFQLVIFRGDPVEVSDRKLRDLSMAFSLPPPGGPNPSPKSVLYSQTSSQRNSFFSERSLQFGCQAEA